MAWHIVRGMGVEMIARFETAASDGPFGTRRKLPNEIDAVTIAEIGTWRYVYIPDGKAMPDVGFEVEPVPLTAETRAALKRASGYVAAINDAVRARVRSRYSIEDEIGLLRVGASDPEYLRWNAWVEECRAWGRAEKAKVGL